jgi:hypothetical protein
MESERTARAVLAAELFRSDTCEPGPFADRADGDVTSFIPTAASWTRLMLITFERKMFRRVYGFGDDPAVATMALHATSRTLSVAFNPWLKREATLHADSVELLRGLVVSDCGANWATVHLAPLSKTRWIAVPGGTSDVSDWGVFNVARGGVALECRLLVEPTFFAHGHLMYTAVTFQVNHGGRSILEVWSDTNNDKCRITCDQESWKLIALRLRAPYNSCSSSFLARVLLHLCNPDHKTIDRVLAQLESNEGIKGGKQHLTTLYYRPQHMLRSNGDFSQEPSGGVYPCFREAWYLRRDHIIRTLFASSIQPRHSDEADSPPVLPAALYTLLIAFCHQ